MNILRRLFTPKVEKDTDDGQNPWAGLASYEDPATAKRELRFCGREEESYDVAKLIMGNTFITLYGKSGIGKTSLLNAGVFPKLREERYTSLSLRLGIRDDNNPQSYQSIIIDAVKWSVHCIEDLDVTPVQEDQQSADYLWKFFANHRFYDKNGNPTTPVVVLDQFEEIFRGNREEADILLRQLDGCAVNGSSYRYDLNIRFVISIREDDLYRMEDSIDSCYLPALKRCRFRLRSLSDSGARDAILIPGEGLFSNEEKEQIADTIIQIARNKEDNSISTNLLSLVCNRLYVESQKAGAPTISLSLVDSFVKGNPFERFYNEATQGFRNHEKSFIEENFVDSTGRRNSISETDFLAHVKNGNILLDGSRRILQRTSTSSDGGVYRVELIHDSFCEPLTLFKAKRLQRRKVFYVLISVFLVTLVVGIISFMLNQKAQNWRLKKIESLYIAAKAENLLDNGDSYLARLLLLKILPEDISNPDRPYTEDAEAALRKACNSNNAILYGHSNVVNSASYSPDGNYIVSASADSTIRIWDAKTGKQITIIKLMSPVCFASFSSNGERIVSASADKEIRIWKSGTGEQIGEPLKEHTGSVNLAFFSPNGERIVSASADNTLRIWDARTGRQIGEPLKGHTDSIFSVTFNHDGDRIVSASRDGTIRTWDTNTGKQIEDPIKYPLSSVLSASFSQDGKFIALASEDTITMWNIEKNKPTGKQIGSPFNNFRFVSSSSDGKHIVSYDSYEDIIIWNVETGEQMAEEHKKLVRYASFSPNGNNVVTASSDHTIRFWDIESGIQQNEIKEVKVDSIACYYYWFSPDGKRIVSMLKDNTIRIWSTETGEEICKQPLSGLTDSIISCAICSQDGKRIVSASYDGTLRIWDSETGRQIGKLKGHTDYVWSASFSLDGKRIVSASRDNTARIWDVETGELVCKPINIKDSTVAVSFSPDGRRIVSSSLRYNEELRRKAFTSMMWDTETGKPIGEPLKGLSAFIDLFSFSPDGKRFLSISDDGIVRTRDTETGLQIGEPLDESFVSGAYFSLDGKYIVTASDFETIKVWDATTGRQVFGKTIKGHFVVNAWFCLDSKHIGILCLNRDSPQFSYPLILYFTPLQELVDKTRKRFKNRQLTPEEQKKYYLE